jgi:copper chaperone CopZ
VEARDTRNHKEPHLHDLHLLVGGMGCRHCVREVTARLRDVPGVERVVADASTNRVQLTGSMSRTDVLAALATTTFVVRVAADRPTGRPRR